MFLSLGILFSHFSCSFMSQLNHERIFNSFTNICRLEKGECHWTGRLLFNFLLGWVFLLLLFSSFQNILWVLMERLKWLQILLISAKILINPPSFFRNSCSSRLRWCKIHGIQLWNRTSEQGLQNITSPQGMDVVRIMLCRFYAGFLFLQLREIPMALKDVIRSVTRISHPFIEPGDL